MDDITNSQRADYDHSSNRIKDYEMLDKTENASFDIKDQELELLKLTCKKTEAKGDINLFEDMFQSWKNQEKLAEATEKDLKQKLEICEKDKVADTRKIADLEQTVDLLQTSIESLHNDLDLVDKFGKENRELKNVVKESKERLSKQKEAFEQKCVDLEEQLKENKNNYEKEISETQKEMKSKLEDKDKDMSEMMSKKEEELDKLRKEMQIEREKLTVEYENKVVKLQRQKATASMNQQQSSSANQEIFRKKLQHLKKEHEMEVNSLKEQIKNLQEQLNGLKSTHPTGTQNRSSFTAQPLFKKTRRF